jgi:hypothetical protein
MKRRWFQIHLSTILFVTMFAGVLLGLNLKDRDARSQYQAWYAKDYVKIMTWGWPLELGRETRTTDSPLTYRYTYQDYPKIVAINIAACLLMCLGVMAVCEMTIRMMTRGKPVRAKIDQASDSPRR